MFPCLTASSVFSRVQIVGREILDSRANPTVEADVYALIRGEEQLVARAGAPSGASTGSNEAHELRDEDKTRFGGKGVRTAANNVSTALNDAVKGQDPRNLKKLDDALCAADGTPLKTKLGGNAITAASFALAEAGAKLSNKELYLHLAASFHGEKLPAKFSLPRPMVNIINGGKHAGGDLRIQVRNHNTHACAGWQHIRLSARQLSARIGNANQNGRANFSRIDRNSDACLSAYSLVV